MKSRQALKEIYNKSSSSSLFSAKSMPSPFSLSKRSITIKRAAQAASLVYGDADDSVNLEGCGPPIRTRFGEDFVGKKPRFDMIAWKDNEKREIIVSVRGSAIELDWTFNNLFIAFNVVPTRYNVTKEFVKNMKEAYKDYEIVVVGHSLGGALAQLVCAAEGTKGVTFNAPPMRSVLDGDIRFDLNLSQEQQLRVRDSSILKNFRTTYDPVSLVPGFFVGSSGKNIPSNEMNALKAHGMAEVSQCLDKPENHQIANEDHNES